MRCRAARRLRKRLGRRGHFLVIIGGGKTSWGAGMIVDPPSTPGLSILTSAAPLHCWAWLWIVAGAVTMASAFVQVGRDGIGFIAALVPPAVWALAYATAALDGEFSRGIFVAVWYLTSHVGVIMWAAATPEYSVPPPPRPRKEGT
ncbi:hypothetical protein [Streptomyces sp. NPDC096033]|uniref:hypothetical protein n=1 Tax=Streptomyces sp. NPDC096033 TaxID=3366071 RepID=UPI0037F1EEB6